MEYLVQFFAWLMDWCHSWCPNWWADIVIFTFFTKILQFPVSLWCQVNSLKMVSLMPEEIRIKIDRYGDKDAIGEATAALYKREHYHPLLSLVPLAINIVILMAFVKVIYGIGDRLTVPGMAKPLIACVPWTDGGLAWAMPLLAGAAAWLLGFSQNIFNPLQHEQTRAQQLTTNGISISISLFLGCFVAAGVGLYWATSNVFSILVQWGENLCIPPKSRVNYTHLRRAQAEWRKFESSLRKGEVSKEDKAREKADYKRFFKVANKHVVFYAEGGGYYKYFQSVIEWLLAHSNVVIHYVTNDPKDAIFEKLKCEVEVEDRLPRRPIDASHTTSTPTSTPTPTPTPTSTPTPISTPTPNFNSRLRPYYIGPTKIIPLMMKMDADMVVMTTPDLNTFHIKRSYVKKDVEYVYLDHGPTSVHMCYRKGAFDHFDTIMCNGPFQVAEHRATEALYHLKPKKLVESGYPLLDTLTVAQERDPPGGAQGGSRSRVTASHRIMIANSHQKDNIFDACLDDLIASITSSLFTLHSSFTIVLRPHPQYVRRFPARWQAIKEKLSNLCPPPPSASTCEIVVEDDFSLPSTMDQSDILITDWSGIAYEFAYKTRRPTLFVNTPMKVINPEWKKIDLVPTDISFRDEVGVSVELEQVREEGQRSKAKGQTEDGQFPCRTSDLGPVASALSDMLAHPDAFAAKIDAMFAKNFFHPGAAGEAVGGYILDSLIEKRSKK